MQIELAGLGDAETRDAAIKAQTRSWWACCKWEPTSGEMAHCNQLCAAPDTVLAHPAQGRPSVSGGYYTMGAEVLVLSIDGEMAEAEYRSQTDYLGMRFRVSICELSPLFRRGQIIRKPL